MEPRHLKLKHPFTSLVAGPTSSGKSVLVRRLLKNYLKLTTINASRLKVTYCYGQWQPEYNTPIDNVELTYVDGLVSQAELTGNLPHILVIDDLMNELGGDKKLANLFTKGSHHLGISIIFIVQNIFHQAKEMRNISLNSHYIFVMKNPRDKSQVYALARQVEPNRSKFFIECFEDATRNPYSSLLIDLRADTPDDLRLRTRIFPEETTFKDSSPIVYVSKQK